MSIPIVSYSWRLEFQLQPIGESDARAFPGLTTCGVISFFLDAVSFLEGEELSGQSRMPVLTITVLSKECARDVLNVLAENGTVSWRQTEACWKGIYEDMNLPNSLSEELVSLEGRMLEVVKEHVPKTLQHIARRELHISLRARPN